MANPNSTPIPTPIPGDIPSLLSSWGGNLKRNTRNAFADMHPKDYIRLVWIIGAYCLLRPYLIKLGAKMQAKSHEQDSADTGAEIHPNELRGKVDIPGVESEDEEEEEQKGGWGGKARVRQRKFIREAVEKEEKRLQMEQEDESDKEIEEFLIKE